MRVSRAQAKANRENVVNVASKLFREHGFNGIGLSDLMKGAGLTQGGFYKQFSSKDDLIVEASASALENSKSRWVDLAAGSSDPRRALLSFYLSATHLQERAEGCVIASLAPDAARHSPELRQTFQAGIERHLELLDQLVSVAPGEDMRERSMITLSTMVGALVIARAVDDEQVSNHFLSAALGELLKSTPDAAA
ncbi:TetR/AcrR family transcriptional regulator (plasmid) [Devosia neptuniae]|uniref:TetR/AcrR family transcriptional regulator n=1 Tax=Devosia neptuniae TaxID=191302 RepID=A0ABY6C7C3_9HYPH|nr:TetR/AcrR family transcriptional regulator [Devosia neptuniae]UXN68042.1 TetR/AcrR family transcriptional regulator [Devosia neptuniae]